MRDPYRHDLERQHRPAAVQTCWILRPRWTAWHRCRILTYRIPSVAGTTQLPQAAGLATINYRLPTSDGLYNDQPSYQRWTHGRKHVYCNMSTNMPHLTPTTTCGTFAHTTPHYTHTPQPHGAPTTSPWIWFLPLLVLLPPCHTARYHGLVSTLLLLSRYGRKTRHAIGTWGSAAASTEPRLRVRGNPHISG